MDERKKMASALKFSPEEDAAPQVIAKGIGLVAESIIREAEANDVPVYVDEKLSHQLNQLKIGDQIPYELYEVVAEILVFISRVDNK
ncbi:MAG: flagellar biosynthesis protein [Clostridiales bacterium]|jgi:flagellar biosynthesis protein|nr:flagellar biosynthesis protein [Clostridiales bacterium]